MGKPEPISKKEIKHSIVYISLIVIVLVISSLLLITPYWFIWPIIIGALLFAIGYLTASKYTYQCPSCDKSFKITMLTDFLAPHGLTRGENGEIYEWKLLKCPMCRKREKCYRTAN